ncbi:MAG: DUF2341 domain-containing protein [Elusimicrobiales bacterium]|nr:DUF2341 domain-containing protein [Elusimicrobiales bacterium]
MKKNLFFAALFLAWGCAGGARRGDVAAGPESIPYAGPAEPPAPEPAPVEALAAPAPEHAPDASFPGSWKYRENLRVAERSGAALADYQVLVKLDTAAPVRLGRLKPDCSDLRFANSNEVSLLNYWLESGCNTAETRVWVRLPFLAKNSVKNIYAYYGNRAARSESSGENTFVFFDDFEGQGPDARKWRFLRGDCPVAQSGGRLKFTGCGSGTYTQKAALASVPDFRPPYVLEFDGWSSDSGENGMYREIDLRWDGELVGPYRQANSAVGVLLYDGYSIAPGCLTDECIAGQATINPWQNGTIDLSTRSPGRPLTSGVWRRYRVTDDGELVTVYAGDKALLSARVAGPLGQKLGLSAREYPSGGEVHYDNFRVRRFAPAEPEVYPYEKGNARGRAAR